jgi:hypothetical protein
MADDERQALRSLVERLDEARCDGDVGLAIYRAVAVAARGRAAAPDARSPAR